MTEDQWFLITLAFLYLCWHAVDLTHKTMTKDKNG